MPATLASTTVRYSAACTMFFVVTTRSAPMTIAAARMPNAICWATISCCALFHGGSLLGALLLLGAGLEGRRLGHGDHPLAQALLVVQQVGDVGLAVLELGRPEQRVERADLDTDAAVHAQRVIDVEAVEVLHGAGLAALPPGRRLVLVALDVDAPVRAAASAQHADGAVLLFQCDDAAGPGGRRFLDA